MSVPRATNRKGSDADHSDKTNLEKKKSASGPTGTKNGTPKKTEIQGQTNTHRRSSVTEHTNAQNKVDAKKHSAADTHTKTTNAGNIDVNEK
jgi:hypothetical protein